MNLSHHPHKPFPVESVYKGMILHFDNRLGEVVWDVKVRGGLVTITTCSDKTFIYPVGSLVEFRTRRVQSCPES